MNGLYSFVQLFVLSFVAGLPITAEVPPQERSAIDRIIGAKGSYAPDDAAYKLVLPREAATIVQDYQTLSPNFGLNSWVTFSSAIHHPATMNGEFLLLDDEVNPVLSAALDAGLDVTGLAESSIFDGPRLYTLNVSGRGSFQTLASAFRKGLDEVRRVRRSSAAQHHTSRRPSLQIESAIDGRPLDAILSMSGSTAGGVYRAAIGKRAMLNGELIGREMGISTWVSFGGTDNRAVVHGEFVETPDDLQKVLKAMTARGLNIELIRNHTAAEHPQFISIHYWVKGPAIDVAKSIRYVLDIEVGAITPGARL